MLDELFEQVVDELCERVPAFCRPRLVAASAKPPIWRLNLYLGTAARTIGSMVRQVHTDAGLERFMRSAMVRRSGGYAGLHRAERAARGAWAALLSACRRGRFACALFLTLLAALGVCATRDAQVAACAASLALWWLSIAMEEEYPPVCGPVRQRYLAATLLRGACLLPMLFRFFVRYARLGVQSNVVLQGAMVVAIFLHGALFLSLIAFNRRQSAFLRALAGVLGFVPALTAAAAVAAAVASLGGEAAQTAFALLSALGALLAFAEDQRASLCALGALRLRYGAVYALLLPAAGFLLMLLGAWLAA